MYCPHFASVSDRLHGCIFPWLPTAFRRIIIPRICGETLLSASIPTSKSVFVTSFSKAVAPGAHALLVLDGAGCHIAKDLNVPDNITLLPLPPYAPELNPIENVWQYLRANKLAITVFDSYAEIVDKCCDAWNFFANDPGLVASITSRSWATVSH